jgi:serine/threonine-protein kinase
VKLLGRGRGRRFRTGERLGERFVLETRAGVGGMGEVWRARDGASGGVVALKILSHGRVGQRRRFAWEARLLAQLDHARIVRHLAHDVLADGTAYLAMEWLEGCDLRHRLARGSLSVEETLLVAAHAADALAAVHDRHMVHRDVKPSNLFLVGGDVAGLKLIDFGVARLLEADWSLTRTGMILGTPGYAAPEQMEGAAVEPTADVFALGCVLYVCLGGRAPFGGANARSIADRVILDPPLHIAELVPGLDHAVADLIMSMIAKDPDARPADGGELGRRWRALGADATRSGPPSATAPWAAHGPTLASARPSASADLGAPTRLEGALGRGARRAPPRPGAIVAGRYRVERLLGRGGMGTLWIARDAKLDRPVAVKVLAEHLIASAHLSDRFSTEATAAARLRSHHIVQVHDHGIDHGLPYIVMELLEGEDLGHRLRRRGRLGLVEVACVMAQAAKALGVAHAGGVIHRDIKPSNIFLARVPGEPRAIVKLLDFGVAKLIGPVGRELTATGALLGSLSFMSPEQLRGGREATPASDLWSLAVTAYAALTGRLPFEGGATQVMMAIARDAPEAPSVLVPGLPPALDGFFARALAKEASERFATAAELAAELQRAVGLDGGEDAWPTPEASTPERVAPPSTAEIRDLARRMDEAFASTDVASVVPTPSAREASDEDLIATRRKAPSVSPRRGFGRLRPALGLVALALALGASTSLLATRPRPGAACASAAAETAGTIASRALGTRATEAPPSVVPRAAASASSARPLPHGAVLGSASARPRPSAAPPVADPFGY